MASPFPGMDPYIEACGLWEDFHKHIIEDIARELADAAPEGYIVRTGERSYLVLVDAEDKKTYPFLPDVSVTESRSRRKDDKKGGTAVAEPAAAEEQHVLRAFVKEEHREAFLEIYQTDPEKRLVTTIEVLSPANKRPGTEGWDPYQRKRQSLLLSDTNLVEIDLLRGGTRMPMLDPWPKSPYVLMVARAGDPERCRVREGHFQRPLPAIPVPLAKGDADLNLALQPLVETIYRRFRYERSINYAARLTPPLSTAEAAWFRRQLRTRRPS